MWPRLVLLKVQVTEPPAVRSMLAVAPLGVPLEPTVPLHCRSVRSQPVVASSVTLYAPGTMVANIFVFDVPSPLLPLSSRTKPDSPPPTVV